MLRRTSASCLDGSTWRSALSAKTCAALAVRRAEPAIKVAHRAQFAALGRAVTEAGPGAVVCGDFNVARQSPVFGAFTAATGLADAFGRGCPPTFRAGYLPAGATPHCI